MTTLRVRSTSEVLAALERHQRRDYVQVVTFERQWADSKCQGGMEGFSYTAKRMVDFAVARGSAGEPPHWQETLVCPVTGMNNRQRASMHFFDGELCCYQDAQILLTECVTPLGKWLMERYPNAVGSEYLGADTPAGAVVKGVRHEDLTKLSFEDGSLDAVVSLECLEHIPDYRQAFAECARVLRSGGRMLWSVPFLPLQTPNLARAVCHPDGTVEHLLPAEYHGDPVRPNEGALCFTHFGWEMLDIVRAVGFQDVYALMYWSIEFGYLGAPQFQFVAWKA